MIEHNALHEHCVKFGTLLHFHDFHHMQVNRTIFIGYTKMTTGMEMEMGLVMVMHTNTKHGINDNISEMISIFGLQFRAKSKSQMTSS